MCVSFRPSCLEMHHASHAESSLRDVFRGFGFCRRWCLFALCLNSWPHSWRLVVVGLLLLRCQITQNLGRLSLLSWELRLSSVSSKALEKLQNFKTPWICRCLLISVPAYFIPSGECRDSPSHLTDRQQREPEGLGQISVIYATKPFNVRR